MKVDSYWRLWISQKSYSQSQMSSMKKKLETNQIHYQKEKQVMEPWRSWMLRNYTYLTWSSNLKQTSILILIIQRDTETTGKESKLYSAGIVHLILSTGFFFFFLITSLSYSYWIFYFNSLVFPIGLRKFKSHRWMETKTKIW